MVNINMIPKEIHFEDEREMEILLIHYRPQFSHQRK